MGVAASGRSAQRFSLTAAAGAIMCLDRSSAVYSCSVILELVPQELALSWEEAGGARACASADRSVVAELQSILRRRAKTRRCAFDAVLAGTPPELYESM